MATKETISPRLAAHLEHMRSKYDDLVSYARKTEESLKYPLVRELFERVHQAYPEEAAELSGEGAVDSQWAHGFNSGVLATVRLILTACEDFTELDKNAWDAEGVSYTEEELRTGGTDALEQALHEWPMLDT